jgi:hypothetical protein
VPELIRDHHRFQDVAGEAFPSTDHILVSPLDPFHQSTTLSDELPELKAFMKKPVSGRGPYRSASVQLKARAIEL